jgi:hypothetical protein
MLSFKAARAELWMLRAACPANLAWSGAAGPGTRQGTVRRPNGRKQRHIGRAAVKCSEPGPSCAKRGPMACQESLKEKTRPAFAESDTKGEQSLRLRAGAFNAQPPEH